MPALRKPTVTIVEDDPILAFLFREICSAGGWRVIGEADCFPDALGLLGQELPDLVLIDYLLQGQNDGMELLAAVKQRWPHVHTTLITGWDIEALSARIDYVEADTILMKPIAPRVLTAHLDECASASQLLVPERISATISSTNVV